MVRIYPGIRRKGRASPPPMLPITRKHTYDAAAARYRPRRALGPVIPHRLRRFLRSRRVRVLLYIFIIWSIVEVILVQRRLASPSRGRDSSSTSYAAAGSLQSSSSSSSVGGGGGGGSARQQNQRIYIASIHWNNGIILSERWNDAVVDAARALGPGNVFVSVYESGSWDDSKEALVELDRRLGELGVPRNITMSDLTHVEEISHVPEGKGWIDTPRGERELRRIPFLAGLRNRTLRDLIALREMGVHFDKILFLNDVVFTAEDILTLLDTNDGSYAAACSLDFSKPPNYYDTFALRDSEGQAHLSLKWPYFRSSLSRNGMIGNWPAVPVTSCWNGIVAMPSAPFVSETSPLRFRAVPDSLARHHVEGSECCLIHADNPLSAELGVWLNPRVRVGYSAEAYDAVNPAGARRGGSWMSAWRVFHGLWASRLGRWFSWSGGRDSMVHRRVKKWQAEAEGNVEPGEFCLINEMQVLIKNGWAHV